MPNVLDIAKSLGIENPRLVGASSATSQGQPFRGEPKACSVAPVRPEQGQYDITLICETEYVTSSCRGITDDSVIVGAGSTAGSPGESRFWTWRRGTVCDLNITATNSGAIAINDRGDVGGAFSDGVGTLRPFVLRGGELVELMPNAVVDAAVQALALDGTAVGYVSLSPTDRGQLQHRPAIWSPAGALKVLYELPADWGTAIAVNSQSEVLLWLHVGMTSLTALYKGEALQLLGATGLPGLIPIGLDDQGRVLGFFNDSDGQPNPCLWTNDRGVEGLGRNLLPSAISSSGWISGSRRADGFERPWTRSPDGQTHDLPYLPDHWCRPAAVNDRGEAVGSCSADGHHHAAYWRRFDS